jgi:hypothetical protein
MNPSKASLLEDYDSKRDYRKCIVSDMYRYKKLVEECEMASDKANRELREAKVRLEQAERSEERNREEINELWRQLVEEK